MAQEPGRKVTVDRDAAADYLASLLEELVPLAQRSGLHVVAYLLDMAQLEVSAVRRNSAQESDRLRRKQ